MLEQCNYSTHFLCILQDKFFAKWWDTMWWDIVSWHGWLARHAPSVIGQKLYRLDFTHLNNCHTEYIFLTNYSTLQFLFGVYARSGNCTRHINNAVRLVNTRGERTHYILCKTTKAVGLSRGFMFGWIVVNSMYVFHILIMETSLSAIRASSLLFKSRKRVVTDQTTNRINILFCWLNFCFVY